VPEGDTVHLAALRLNQALGGRRLLRTDFRVPAFATSDLSGQTVLGVVARGKHLLLRTDARITLHTHFKMDGSWHLYRRGEAWSIPGNHVRVVLETEDGVAVGVRLGITELIPTDRENDAVGHLGPDVLGPDWDPEEAVRRLGADPNRAVGDALSDQRVMAGPGNIYRSEVCFLRGIHPQAPIGSVADLAALVALTKRLMEANRATGRQITTGVDRPGLERWVYGRRGRPCRRCGTAIRRQAEPSERVVYWCPNCQPEPGPQIDRTK
jgi:endonuclease-8